MRVIPFLLLPCVLFTGCLKRNEHNVNAHCSGNCMTFQVTIGTGLNAATPVANAKVELGWNKPAIPLGDAGRLIATGTTGADGRVNFSFKALSKELTGGKYYINVEKGNDHIKSTSTYYDIQKADTTVTSTVYLPSKATLKLVLKNFTPQASGDGMLGIVYYQAGDLVMQGLAFTDPAGMPYNTFFTGSGTAFTKLELTGTTAGDTYSYIKVTKNKGGVRSFVDDSVYIAKGETKTYEIDY